MAPAAKSKVRDQAQVEQLARLEPAARAEAARTLARDWTRGGVRRVDPLLKHPDAVMRRAAFAVLQDRVRGGRRSPALGTRLAWAWLDAEAGIRALADDALGPLNPLEAWRLCPESKTLSRLARSLSPEAARFLEAVCRGSWRAAGRVRAATAGAGAQPEVERLRRAAGQALALDETADCPICDALPDSLERAQYAPTFPRAAAALVPSLFGNRPPAHKLARCPECGSRYEFFRYSEWDEGLPVEWRRLRRLERGTPPG